MENENITNEQKIEKILNDIYKQLDITECKSDTLLEKLETINDVLKTYPSIIKLNESDILDYYNAEDLIYWMSSYEKENALDEFLCDINVNRVKDKYGPDKFYDNDILNESLQKCAACIGKYYSKDEMIKNIDEYIEKNWYKLK